jgi:hypothetical protein
MDVLNGAVVTSARGAINLRHPGAGRMFALTPSEDLVRNVCTTIIGTAVTKPLIATGQTRSAGEVVRAPLCIKTAMP